MTERRITQRDIDYAEKEYRKYLNLYGKDNSATKIWRSTILRLNNRISINRGGRNND